MPKIPHKQPSDRCVKCTVHFAWSRSDQNLCYWCHNNIKESRDGNKSLQRPPNNISRNDSRHEKNNHQAHLPSLVSSVSDKQSLNPYPIARKRIPKPREDN